MAKNQYTNFPTTQYTPNWTYYNAPRASRPTSGTAQSFVTGAGKGKTYTNPHANANAGGFSFDNIIDPELMANLGVGVDQIMSPRFNYSLESGLQGWGKNLGGYMNIANVIGQGFNAAQGLKNNADIANETEDLTSSIVASAMNNPMVNYDLSADQKQLLSKLQRGTYDDTTDLSDIDLLGALGNGAMGALSGIGGGIPGMIIGGIGGAINSGIRDIGNAQNRKNAELQALYAALQESNRNYGDMRRQRYLSSF